MELIDNITLLGIAIKSILNYFFKARINNLVKIISELIILIGIIVAVMIDICPESVNEIIECLLKGTLAFGSIYGLGYAGSKGIEYINPNKKDK